MGHPGYREKCPGITIVMQKRPKPKSPTSRSGPDLPSEVSLLGNAAATFAADEVLISEQTVENLALRELTAGSITLEGCVLDRVDLSESKIGSLCLKDVRLSNCDLANLDCRSLVVVRAEFLGCRMTGFRAVESNCRDLLLSEGDQRYSRWTQGRFASSEFSSCNFEDADLQECDLRGAIFRNCNLRNAELTGSKLEDADLRGSHVEGLRVGAKDLFGAVVDPAQAMTFAALLGLKIR